MHPRPGPTKAASLSRSPQRGFTLIELVAAIVILGVLAAVATSKFADLRGEAHNASIAATAAAFKVGIDNARLAWRIAPNGNQELTGSEGLASDFGAGVARFTDEGWLVGTSSGATLDDAKCREVWRVVFPHGPEVSDTWPAPGAAYVGSYHWIGFCYYVKLKPDGTALSNAAGDNTVYVGYRATGAEAGLVWTSPWSGSGLALN